MYVQALHQHCQWKYHIPRTVDKIDPKSNIETLSDNDKEKLNGIIKYMKQQVDDKNNQSSFDENGNIILVRARKPTREIDLFQ